MVWEKRCFSPRPPLKHEEIGLCSSVIRYLSQKPLLRHVKGLSVMIMRKAYKGSKGILLGKWGAIIANFSVNFINNLIKPVS